MQWCTCLHVMGGVTILISQPCTFFQLCSEVFFKNLRKKILTKKDSKYLRFYIFLDNKTKLDHTTIIIIIEDIYGKSILK